MIRGAELLVLSNGDVEVGAALNFGPRILRLARPGGTNVFGEIQPDTQGKDTPFGGKWHLYGGHRLWYAPEDDPKTYYPDNARVTVTDTERTMKLVQEVEPHTQLIKSIEVILQPKGGLVTVVHRIQNRGPAAIDLAPWALTVMARGGMAIFPHPPYQPHPQVLAPSRPMVMWPFTRMRDKRWSWGDRLVTLRHDPSREDAQKIGFYDADGWMAYAIDGQLFVKLHDPKPGMHADHGCNVETFTNHLILELETLGPLVKLAPDATIEHVEWWRLFDGVTIESADENALARDLAPYVERAKSERASVAGG